MTLSYEATLIEKSNLKGCIFPIESIHNSKKQRRDLLIKLKIATILGNVGKVKCKIYFKDDHELKVVETTIWETYEDNVILKAGINIPIRRILDVII